LQKQWQQELDEKFYMSSIVLDGASFNRLRNVFKPQSRMARRIAAQFEVNLDV
jgi:hypothetical protein